MSKPTPTPWSVREFKITTSMRYEIVPIGFELYHRICGGGSDAGKILYSVEQAKADAEHIVHCVNTHNDLREALRRLYTEYVVDLHGERTCDCDPSVGIDSCAPCLARAALEQTEVL